MIDAAIAHKPGARAEKLPWTEAKSQIAPPLSNDADLPLVWVDVHNPTSDEIRELQEAFALHPLTTQDLKHRNQRAKIESYPGYVFVVLHWFLSPDVRSPRVGELHCVVGKNFLLTVTDGEPVIPLTVAREHFLQGHGRGPHGPDGQLYWVLDEVVDAHFPCVLELEERVEQISAEVVAGGDARLNVQKIIDVRRSLVTFRRALAPQRDVLSALARRDFPVVSERAALYFRDVYDHLSRTYEAVESLRELVESVMEVNLAMSESRQNQIIKRLTLISTVFLPLNFLTGFFGMNFTHLPFESTGLFLIAVAVMLGLPTALTWFFFKKGWV